MKSSTLKQMGILIIVLAILYQIVFGLIFKHTDLSGISMFGAILLSVIFKALAEILDNQEKIMSELLKQSREIHNVRESTEPATANQYNPPPVHNVGDSWICSNCGEKNPLNMRICKSCGQDK